MTSAFALFGIVIAFPIRRIMASEKIPAAAANLPKASKTAPAGNAGFRIPNRALTPAEHFGRAAQVITSALCSAKTASEMHEHARIQLEVVEFSIDRILEEVADVMALTPEMQRRFKPALVAIPAAGQRRRAA